MKLGNTSLVGTRGEQIAADYLLKQNYQIISRNFRTRYGEIDIICKSVNTIVFVEVKARRSYLHGKPYESVTTRKISHLFHAINLYLSQNNLFNFKHRLDVISIEFGSNLDNYHLQHFENLEI